MNVSLDKVEAALATQYKAIEAELALLERAARKAIGTDDYLEGKRSGLIAARTALWKAMNDIRVAAGMEPTRHFNTNRATA